MESSQSNSKDYCSANRTSTYNSLDHCIVSSIELVTNQVENDSDVEYLADVTKQCKVYFITHQLWLQTHATQW